MSNVLFSKISKTDSLPGLSGKNAGLVFVDGEASAKVLRGNAHVDVVGSARRNAHQQLADIATTNGYVGYVLYHENVTFSAVGNHAIVSVTAEAIAR